MIIPLHLFSVFAPQTDNQSTSIVHTQLRVENVDILAHLLPNIHY